MTHVHLWDAQKLPISSRNGHFRPFKNRSGLINSFGLINSDSKNYPTFSIKYGCNQLISISNNIFYFNIFHPECIRPNEFIRPDGFLRDPKWPFLDKIGRVWASDRWAWVINLGLSPKNQLSRNHYGRPYFCRLAQLSFYI